MGQTLLPSQCMVLSIQGVVVAEILCSQGRLVAGRLNHHGAGRSITIFKDDWIGLHTDECTRELYASSLSELAEPCVHAI